MSQNLNPYSKSISILKEVLGEEKFKAIEQYLHSYDGTQESVRPVAKYITIYWLGRAADRMILRTEGEDDIILSQVGDESVPTIVFRKFKAVYLREYMKLLRVQWFKYGSLIRDEVYKDSKYNFLKDCSISPGIAGEGKGAMHGRCMKCPVDVLMGATRARVTYNLASRFVGDSAYALTASFERRTGNSVDEISYTTIMITGRESEEEKRTGGLFSETLVKPGTLFVGKIVLTMLSPVELLYILWLLHRVTRVGARTSIWGTLEVEPIAMVADVFEVGTSYEAAEEMLRENDIAKAREKLLEYVKSVAFQTSSDIIELTKDTKEHIRSIDILNKELVKELWNNAKNYIKGIEEYLKSK